MALETLKNVEETLRLYREEFGNIPMKRKILIETSDKTPLEIARKILRFAK